MQAVLSTGKDSSTRLRGSTPSWTGSVRSECHHIDVVAPEGIDLEAFEAYDGDPLATWEQDPDPGRYGELLRRFPTSTYAAFVVRQSAARTVVNTKISTALKHMSGVFFRGNSVPCDDPSRCDENGWLSLSAEELLAWKERWIGLVLERHPGIWFADDLRFTRALDRYLLGDKDGCRAELEQLGAKGKSYVAEKAKELLAAMRAKGMLEEGS